MADINGVEFTPQEEEAIRIALDRMENAEEDAAANAAAHPSNEFDSDEAIEADEREVATHRNEAAVARSAREKFREAMSGDRVSLGREGNDRMAGQVEAMYFGNDITDSMSLDLPGWMVRDGEHVLFCTIDKSEAERFAANQQIAKGLDA